MNIINTQGTVVVAGFPGVGKTYCTRNNTKYRIADSDSSTFSHDYVDRVRVLNPSFPDNYINHIKAGLGNYDIIFVSTHAEVRKALKEEKIPYVLVYPDPFKVAVKMKYVKRYQDRGNTPTFISDMIDKWEDFVGSCYIDEWPVHYVLGEDETLSDVIENIYEMNKNWTNWEENTDKS